MSDATGKPFGDIYAYIDAQIAAAVLAAATDHQTLSHRLRPYDGHDLYPRVDGARGMDSGANLEQGREPVTDLETATRAWVLNQVSGADVIKPPLGFDTTALSGVVSRWRVLTSIQGGTDLPDDIGTHGGTIGSGTYKIAGRPFYSSDGNALINQATTLADSANLRTQLRDASCAFMAWVTMEHPGADQVLFQALAAGETEAANCLFQATIDTTGAMLWLSEHGVGTNDAVTGPIVAPGTHCLLWQRERNTGAGTSTITFGIDGVFVQQTSGVTNPSGGTTATGSITPTGSGSVYLGECLLASGALITEAQFLTQYKRGMGVY